MNKPVGMLVGGFGVVLCKVLVGGTCVGGICVAVAWLSRGGLGRAIIGTVPSRRLVVQCPSRVGLCMG